jgi:hypothetical protein
MADYYLTILGAWYLKKGASEHFAPQGGYELNPMYVTEVEQLRKVSPKFMMWVVINSALLTALWFCAQGDPSAVSIYRFFCGMLMLRTGVIVLRHAESLTILRSMACHEGVSGNIQYERWLSYRLSAVSLAGFSTLFLLTFLLTGSAFVLGGSVSCLLLAVKHRIYSRRAARVPKLPEGALIADRNANATAVEERGIGK